MYAAMKAIFAIAGVSFALAGCSYLASAPLAIASQVNPQPGRTADEEMPTQLDPQITLLLPASNFQMGLKGPVNPAPKP